MLRRQIYSSLSPHLDTGGIVMADWETCFQTKTPVRVMRTDRGWQDKEGWETFHYECKPTPQAGSIGDAARNRRFKGSRSAYVPDASAFQDRKPRGPALLHEERLQLEVRRLLRAPLD